MNRLIFTEFLGSTFICLLLSCKSRNVEIERAFYYWKSSEYSLNETELSCLKDQNIRKLYVKFFEVDMDTLLGAVPVSKTDLHIWNYTPGSGDDSLLVKTMCKLEIVPTVYIENNVLRNLSAGNLDSLAVNILYLIDRYYNRQIRNRNEPYAEIQLDCDWTEETRESYFNLLRKIRALSKKSVSCTLRLYPYKYRDKMGIPPADKAVLMCYNLINPFASEDKNSILTINDLESYLKRSGRYPIHLDFALPVYSWMLVYQNNRFAGTISPPPEGSEDFLKPVKPLWYIVTKDKEFDNLYLRAGDKVKLESVSSETMEQTMHLLRKYVPADPHETIILFHLGADNLNKLDNETINSIFSGFYQ